MNRATLMGASCLAGIFMAARTIEEMQTELAGLEDEVETIIDAADADNRELTDAELAQIEEKRAQAQRLGKQIAARAPLVAPQGRGRQTAPESTDDAPAPNRPGNTTTPPGRRVPAEARAPNPTHGFRSFGEFAMAVRAGSIQGNTPDRRLFGAATAVATEGVGTDGGFLIPPTFATEIYEKVMAQENLLGRCAPLTTSTNNMTIPKDETTPWQTSGGIQVFWEGEASQMPQSKPAFELDTIRLVKLTALVPISDELLEDAIGLESWLRAKAPIKMAAKINTGIVGGTGVGQPLGIIPGYTRVAPSVVSVAKEGGQTAGSVVSNNIVKMWARMYAPWRRNAIWLINQDVEPQLDLMAFVPGAPSPYPVYLPPFGLSADGYSTLKGRPVVPIEACSTLGALGDIILVDFEQYWAITKAAGIRTDTSMHLFFDQALTTFRFIFRLNGMPAWSAPIAPQFGTNNRSWAVTLDARS